MAINTKEFTNKVRSNLWANDSFRKFFYRFSFGGKTFRGIVDLSEKSWTKKDRIKYAETKLLTKKEEAENFIDSDATVDQIVQLYFETLPEAKYKKSRYSYYLRYIKKELGSKKAKEIFPRHIQTVVNKNITKGQSEATAKQVVEILSPSFNIARANRIVVHNPCMDVRVRLPPRKKIVVNATEKLKIIYNKIMLIYKDDPFYRAFFMLAIQGRRKSEILNLKWEDISFEHDYYLLADTKSGQEQKIYLSSDVKIALEEFKKAKGWIFESPIKKGQRIMEVKRQVVKLKTEIGEWFGLHYLRNIIVSAMAENGIESIFLSGALGHKDPHTISKYLSINYHQGSKKASDMIDKLSK